MRSDMKPVNVSDSSELTACSSGEVAIRVTKVVLLIPLYIVVLLHGLQKWRKQRSFKSASHSDIFTYHVAAFELMWLFATSFDTFGADVPTPFSKSAVYYFLYTSWNGENFFHVLTCVERYLAVVHPIVYMRLRNERGVRIRNISIVCVWILSHVCSGFNLLDSSHVLPVPFLVNFVSCLVAVSFCSLSALYVLVRPGPGDGAQDRGWVDPAKQRAFFTMSAISMVLWLLFGGLLTVTALDMTYLVSEVKCVVKLFAFMFNLPSYSVLPLLYLNRAGKLSLCCRENR